MNIEDEVRRDIERTAAATGLSPSTVGMRAGQGGQFYARLLDGKRVWPETAEAVKARCAELRSGVTQTQSSER